MEVKAKELLEKRAKLIEENKSLLETAEKEGRELTKDEEAQWDTRDNDINALAKQAEMRKKQEQYNKELLAKAEEKAEKEGRSKDEVVDEKAFRSAAFNKFIRFGESQLNSDERKALYELRAQSVGTDTAGGYSVPDGFAGEIDKALKAFGGVREVSRIISTAGGGDLPFVTGDDTTNTGAILAENTVVTEQDATFGEVRLGAYKYSSKLIRVSLELLQDEAINLESYLGEILGTRIGRITSTHFTTGTGTSQPNGVVTGSAAGTTSASGTAITFDDLINHYHTVDPAYRGNATWMFNDGTLKVIKKLKDSNNNYIWQQGNVSAGAPDTILGKPYVINQDMADIAVNAKAVLFGDFSKYIIRDVLGMQMVVLRERYADYLQVGFMAFSRHDGDILNSKAIKHLLQAAA